MPLYFKFNSFQLLLEKNIQLGNTLIKMRTTQLHATDLPMNPIITLVGDNGVQWFESISNEFGVYFLQNN